MSQILSNKMYALPTRRLAKELLGCFICTESNDGITSGRIVETEAYLSRNDPACHAARGETPRNRIMFGPPGYAYVYFIYGMYDLFNVVSGKEGKGEAVLIRAVEPIDGIDLMKQRRNTQAEHNLTNGPAKLVQALGISRADNGLCLRSSRVQIHTRNTHRKIPLGKVVTTTRIGISNGQDLPLRFYLDKSSFVSQR